MRRLRVTDPADPRLTDYVALTDTALRRRTEPERGLFIAESELVLRRVLAAGHRLRSVLLDERRLPELASHLAAVDAPVYVADQRLLEAVTGFRVHRGVLAAVNRPAVPAAADLVSTARRLVVLEGINNPTNVGTVFRCAAALGMDAVLLDPRCCDPLYRRAIRVSMAAVLSVPYARLSPWPAALAGLRADGFRLLALTPEPAATPLRDVPVDPADRIAVVVGAEGPGLSGRVLGSADERVRIPMSSGMDSLNVGAAAAIACYLLGRKR